MTPEQEQFAIDLANAAEDHRQWLGIVRFGLQTLMENQPLLIEIISQEAHREIERHKITRRVYGYGAYEIFCELGLKLTVV